MPASFPILRLVLSNWIKHIIKDYIHVSTVKTKVMEELKLAFETERLCKMGHISVVMMVDVLD